MFKNKVQCYITKVEYLSSIEVSRVLKKTKQKTKRLLSSLDFKEIKPINPKGNQSWIFVGRTDAEAPTLWPPDVKSWFLGKPLNAGKDWRQKKRGAEDTMARLRRGLNGQELEQTPGDSEGQLPCVGSQRVWHSLDTEQQQRNTGEHRYLIFNLIFVLPCTYLAVPSQKRR